MSIQSLHPNPPAAFLDDGALVISGLVVNQPDVVTLARRQCDATGDPDLGDWTEATLTLGAKARALAGVTVDVDELRRSVTEFADHMTDATAASVRDIKTAVAAAADPDTGAFARTVGAALGELNAGIAKLITEEDVPLRTAVARSVEELTGNALSEIQRALAGQSRTIIDTLNSDNPASPLNGLRLELLRAQRAQGDAIQTQLNELRTVIDVSAAIKQTMERTAVKGADYEDDLEVVLNRLTRGTGDRLERTGAKPGLLGRSKKGDFVAGLSTELTRTHTVNVVFEAKDKTQTLPEWQAELDEARRNRGAVAALGVVKGTEHMPGGDRLRLLDPLTYVVAFDPATDSDDLLLAAYQLLRMHAVTSVLGADADIDVAALRVQLDKAVATLGQIDAITGAAEKAKANLGTITATAARLRDDLTATLGRMQTLVESAGA